MASKPIEEMTLGELLSSKRDEIGINNAELARRTGFSATFVGNVLKDASPTAKSGKLKRLPDETVDKFARALGLSVALVRTKAGLAKPNQAVEEDDEVSALFYDYSKLTKKDKQELKSVMQMIAKDIRERLQKSDSTK